MTTGRHTIPVWLTAEQQMLLRRTAESFETGLSQTVELLCRAQLEASGKNPDDITGLTSRLPNYDPCEDRKKRVSKSNRSKRR